VSGSRSKNPKKNLIFERLFIDQEDVDRVLKLFSSKKYKKFIITLKAPLTRLLKQNSKRPRVLGAYDIKRLYGYFKNSNVGDQGKIIELKNKSAGKIVDEIVKYLGEN